MQYALLIHVDEALYPQMSKEEHGAMLSAYEAFGEQWQTILEGDAPQGAATAMTVHVRDGKALVIDGLFTETKEQRGEFYLVRCDNLDEAVAIASHIPLSCSFEVRPVMEFDQA